LCANTREHENRLKQSRSAASLIAQNREKLESIQAIPGHSDTINSSLAEAGKEHSRSEKQLKEGNQRTALETALSVHEMLVDIQAATAPMANESIEKKINRAERLCNDSNNETAKTLLEKGREHYRRYKALSTQQKADEAVREKEIALQLIEQAIELVSE
jgi:hypothetical protein